MAHSRREFLKSAAATATFASIPLAAAATEAGCGSSTQDQAVALFASLPGNNALKVYAPAVEGKPQLLIESNSSQRLFVASAIKTFVLCEALRQVDSPDVVHTLEHTNIALNESIWSPGSGTFNPPNVTGIVSERTTLEAMITRSDNTATDMMFKQAGVDNVRKFIASAGLNNTQVPDSTRSFTGYLFGATDFRTITWDEVLQIVEGPIVKPFLNNVETLASSADDFVSYYSRALQGDFFQNAETLEEFRRILSLCDFIYLVPLPLGVSAYAKSGNADSAGSHARSIAGGLFFSGRWVYFAFIINWFAAEEKDPDTVSAFFSAINQTLTCVRDSLSS